MKQSKGERNTWRFAYALALLVPFVCIVIAEATGWNVLSVYLVAEGVEYACLVFLAILMGLLLLPALWQYVRSRLF